MKVDELNKCLGIFNKKKTSLLSIKAALDRHLKAPKSFKKKSLFTSAELEVKGSQRSGMYQS